MLIFAMALQVVLSSSEIPHEIAPVHEVDLVGEEEADVVPLRGHFSGNVVVAFVVANEAEGDVVSVHSSEPVVVGLCMLRAVHTGEEHLHFAGEDVVALHFHDVRDVLLSGSLFLGGVLMALDAFLGVDVDGARGVGFAEEEGA